MITTSALTRRFGATTALAGVTLEVPRGEMFALIGPDGAGKTTFFRLVAGVLAPTSGTVTRATGTFGLVPQRFGLYQDLSIDENMRLRSDLYSVPRDEAARRAARLLEMVGLSPFRTRLAGALSGGMKQKLALAAALVTEPDLLLLDEPTTGVDPLSRREFWKLLHELNHRGLTIVVSTPYMDEAEYASRIGFLDGGRLVDVGTRAELLSRFDRPLVAVATPDRVGAKAILRRMPEVDDVSLFGTALHVRGTSGDSAALADAVRVAFSAAVWKPSEQTSEVTSEPTSEATSEPTSEQSSGMTSEPTSEATSEQSSGMTSEVRPIPPSLEDVFVLRSEAVEQAV